MPFAKAGFGWEAGKDIERRLHDAWFETLCNLANHNCCLELSNGRCPWDVFICPYGSIGLYIKV